MPKTGGGAGGAGEAKAPPAPPPRLWQPCEVMLPWKDF